jgi:hypothetical protein
MCPWKKKKKKNNNKASQPLKNNKHHQKLVSFFSPVQKAGGSQREQFPFFSKPGSRS